MGIRSAIDIDTHACGPALRLYDAAGRLVPEERLVLGVNEIEAGALPPGLYFWGRGSQ